MLAQWSLHKFCRGNPLSLKQWKPIFGDMRLLHGSMAHSNEVIGIDVGTMNTRAVVMAQEKVPTVIENESGRALPSHVAVDTEGGFLVGRKAKVHAILHPTDSFSGINHFIGRRFEDPHVQKLMASVPYKIVAGLKGEAAIETRGKTFTPTELLSAILGRINALADAYLKGGSPARTVISVPVFFSKEQRKETELAGRIAGFDILSIIDDSIAAARCCTTIKDGVVAVYSFGGQFLVSILEISDGDIKVKSRSGDPFLGGKDFDLAIFNYLVAEVKRVHEVDLSKDRVANLILMQGAEMAKFDLSSSSEAVINMRKLDTNLTDVSLVLTRAKFEELVSHLVERTRIHCQNSLVDAGLSARRVDEVILTGGMASIPLVQHTVADVFGKDPKLWSDPAEAVAIGAAIQAELITEERRKISPGAMPLSLGFEDGNGQFQKIICRGTVIPTRGLMRVCPSSVDQRQIYRVRVFQGENIKASCNRLLGAINLTNMPLLPVDSTSCDLIFDVREHGRLIVSAGNKIIGMVKKTFKIPELSEEYIRRHVREAVLGKVEFKEFYMREIRRKGQARLDRAQMVLKFKKYAKHIHDDDEMFPLEKDWLETRLESLRMVLNSDSLPSTIESKILEVECHEYNVLHTETCMELEK